MDDNVILQKINSIELCINRIKEEYTFMESSEVSNFSHIDAATLNIQRACEQTIDLANHLVKKYKLGLPDSSRNSIELLYKHDYINESLKDRLIKMVGFRNFAVHEYQSINTKVLVSIIVNNLVDFADFTSLVMEKEL